MKTIPTIDTFADAALTMIADLELNHGVEFTKVETHNLQSALASVAQSYFNKGKQWAKQCDNKGK
jgi:hypothetical protein